jgi:tRNA-dihydrouridine synthase
MLAVTGCHGIAIGRGALLNPWIFAQLQRWEQTGDVGPAAGYADRLEFMVRHLHLLAEHRGERFGCLSFRKVANWYCRALRPGREVQQRLIRLETVAEFDEIAYSLRKCEPYRDNREWPGPELGIKVPSGPVEHW